MYELYCKLRDEKGLKDIDVAKATQIPKSTFSDWKSGRSKPKNEKLKKIALFFDVPLSYFIDSNTLQNDYPTTDEETVTKEIVLTAKDERDIAKDVESIMAKLTAKESGPAAYNGEELSEESAALFRDELEIALRRLKLINKEKYNPHKNKK